jgi:RNA polymerase sigma-70 factor (ECF subfamily)
MAMSQKGDRQAYATLLAGCQRWLRSYCARRITPSQLDDLVQETLLAVHNKLATWEPSRPFLPWLAAIARYGWVNHLRRLYRADECELDEPFIGTDDEPAITARISIGRLLDTLPEPQAQAISLVKIDGLSIAHELKQWPQ